VVDEIDSDDASAAVAVERARRRKWLWVLFVLVLVGGLVGAYGVARYRHRIFDGDGRIAFGGGDESEVTAPTTLPPDDGVSRTERPEIVIEPVEAAVPTASGIAYFEDFESTASMEGLLLGLYHRDDHVVADESWPGDHVSTGPDDECSGPDESRQIERGDPGVFNDDWSYRCVPGGDPAKAHVMTAIGDTSGYSIGSLTPLLSFENIVEVRWDINVTDLGARQFPEVKIIPVDKFDPTNLPCVPDLPCDTDDYDTLGAVGASFFHGRPAIATPDFPDGFRADGWSGVLCHLETDGFCFDDRIYEDDPARLEVKTRRMHYFRDNGDGTLTFGLELSDGSFHELTGPGQFPAGPVRVVFADHSYTPTKDLGPVGSRFTWHWDNLTVAVSTSDN